MNIFLMKFIHFFAQFFKTSAIFKTSSANALRFSREICVAMMAFTACSLSPLRCMARETQGRIAIHNQTAPDQILKLRIFKQQWNRQNLIRGLPVLFQLKNCLLMDGRVQNSLQMPARCWVGKTFSLNAARLSSPLSSKNDSPNLSMMALSVGCSTAVN